MRSLAWEEKTVRSELQYPEEWKGQKDPDILWCVSTTKIHLLDLQRTREAAAILYSEICFEKGVLYFSVSRKQQRFSYQDMKNHPSGDQNSRPFCFCPIFTPLEDTVV